MDRVAAAERLGDVQTGPGGENGGSAAGDLNGFAIALEFDGRDVVHKNHDCSNVPESWDVINLADLTG